MKKLIYRVVLSTMAMFVVGVAVASSDTTAVAEIIELQNDTPPPPPEHRNTDPNIMIWEHANEAYTSNEYAKAIDLYNNLLDNGVESYKVYYNLGNAYFKNNEIAKAIANYKRAERLAPMNVDIEHNLAIADGMTINRIESLPEFFIYKFYLNIQGMMSSNSWAMVSLIAFGLVLLLIMYYLLSNTPIKRKIGFTGAIIMLFVFVVSVSFAVKLRDQIKYSSEAVVLSSAEAVKSSPNSDGKDVFIINEGSVVDIIDSLGEWSEIVVASGNRGWIRTKALEVI